MPDLYIADNQSQPSPTPEEISPGQVEMKKSEPHILASFHEKPEGIRFETQAEGETILLFLRRHYLTNIGWQTTSIIMGILPLVLLAVFPYLNMDLPLPLRFFIIIGLFYYLVVFGYALINFIIWFYNVGIVSNLRLIDIDVTNISSKNVATTAIQDIIDVSYNQNGFQANLFDYGDVLMETEAIKPNFEFLKVPHPARVSDIIGGLLTGKESR